MFLRNLGALIWVLFFTVSYIEINLLLCDGQKMEGVILWESRSWTGAKSKYSLHPIKNPIFHFLTLKLKPHFWNQCTNFQGSFVFPTENVETILPLSRGSQEANSQTVVKPTYLNFLDVPSSSRIASCASLRSSKSTKAYPGGLLATQTLQEKYSQST